MLCYHIRWESKVHDIMQSLTAFLLYLGKWVPEELRGFTRQEDDKPYVPPAYYGEDEEQLDSEDDELNEASSSELEEMSQPQDNSDCVVETQEKSSKVEEVDSVSSSEQSTTNETCVRNRRKSDGLADVVTDESTSVATNFDEDASMASTNGSGVMFVSNSKDGTSSSWSWYQQKQLEWALVQYPKFGKERWENIAKAVPGKSKVNIYSKLA